jgi:putative oxidoreductase
MFSDRSRTSSTKLGRSSNVNILSNPERESSEPSRSVPIGLAGSSSIARWAPIPLRLIVGCGFILHGFAKLSRGPDAFAGILHSIGIPMPHFMAWTTILIEVLGGIAFLLGAFTALISLPMAALLMVAVFTVNLPYGFSSIKLIAVTPAGAQFGPPGYECDLLYLACLAALVINGSGPLSIDGLIRRRRNPGPAYKERHE